MTWIAAGFTIMCVVQVFTLAVAWYLSVELKAMQKSTHQVQFIPADQSFQKLNEELKQQLGKDVFENLG